MTGFLGYQSYLNSLKITLYIGFEIVWAVFSFLPLTLDFTAFLGYPFVQGRGRFYAFSTLPFAIAFGVECEWFVFWREPKVS